MHSATAATGRPLPPPGKSLPKNRPAPLSCRAAHQLAAAKTHVTYVTSHRQCHIPARASTRRSSRIMSRAKFNRKPRRLEFTLSRTKQTPAPQINRQQIATSKITIAVTSNRDAAQAGDRHSSLATRHCRSNRHSVRLENAISHRKQTLGTLSNRHFLRVSGSHNLRIAEANRPPQASSNIISNRQWQILENDVNPSKQTIAPRSNRQQNAISNCQKSRSTTARPESRFARRRAEVHQSLLTNHHSRRTSSSEFPRSGGESVLWLGCVCCSCNTFRFDEGAASSHLRPLLLYGWRRSRSKQIA
jgi:hypothetical protein